MLKCLILQKTTIIIAVLLVTTSLSIGIIIGLTWHNQTPINNNPLATPTTSPQLTLQPTTNTNTPIPYGTPTPKVMISYNELSRTNVGSNTRLTLSVDAYQSITYCNLMTLDYSNFTLAVFVPRGGLAPPTIVSNYVTVNALESGTVSVGGIDEASTFLLTFEFPSEGSNFDGNFVLFSAYQLGYSGNPSFIEWADR